jgi:hypothetical protein
VQLSEPRPIDCRDPEDEIDLLYESVVAPHRHAKESKARIEGQIRKCLGQLAEEFRGRQRLPGFGGRAVHVQRVYRGQKRDVIVEGVNLAGAQPDQHVDALVSKLMRLIEGPEKKCTFLVGYLASPHGLNGEAPLVEWLERKTAAKTFNLKTQREDFHEAARQSVRSAGRQLIMSEASDL